MIQQTAKREVIVISASLRELVERIQDHSGVGILPRLADKAIHGLLFTGCCLLDGDVGNTQTYFLERLICIKNSFETVPEFAFGFFCGIFTHINIKLMFIISFIERNIFDIPLESGCVCQITEHERP